LAVCKGNNNPKTHEFVHIKDDKISIKLPWMLLNFSDPSQYAVIDDDTQESQNFCNSRLACAMQYLESSPTTGVALTLIVGGEVAELPAYSWYDWDLNSQEILNPRMFTEVEKESLAIIREALKKAPFAVDKVDHDMSGVTFAGKTVTYNGEAHSITASNLPDGVTVAEYAGNNKTNAGTYLVTVKFAVTDPENYNVPEDMTATLIILEAEAVTGIEEPAELPVTLYPNPNAGQFTLIFATRGVYSISVANLAGQVLKHEIAAGEIVQMDISGYAKGVYLIIIENGKRKMTMRVVKE